MKTTITEEAISSEGRNYSSVNNWSMFLFNGEIYKKLFDGNTCLTSHSKHAFFPETKVFPIEITNIDYIKSKG